MWPLKKINYKHMKNILIIPALLIFAITTAKGQDREIPYEIKYILTDKVENQFDTLVEIRLVMYETDYNAATGINLAINNMDGTKKSHNKLKSEIKYIKTMDLTAKDEETAQTKEKLKFNTYVGNDKARAVEISLGLFNLSEVSEIIPQIQKAN